MIATDATVIAMPAFFRGLNLEKAHVPRSHASFLWLISTMLTWSCKAEWSVGETSLQSQRDCSCESLTLANPSGAVTGCTFLLCRFPRRSYRSRFLLQAYQLGIPRDRRLAGMRCLLKSSSIRLVRRNGLKGTDMRSFLSRPAVLRHKSVARQPAFVMLWQ